MKLSSVVLLSLLSLVSGFTLPNSDLESGLTKGDSENSGHREKRHLFKKWKKHGGSSSRTHYQTQSSSVIERPGREVHHYHYYSRPPPGQYYERPFVPSQPAPVHEYNHYQGGYSGGYSAGYSGQGSSSYYGGQGKGGSSYYGGQGDHYNQGGYYAPPPPQGPIDANPAASSYNGVHRGQGAAAVNNIAIIHARSGSSSDTVSGSDGPKLLPRPLSIDDISAEAK